MSLENIFDNIYKSGIWNHNNNAQSGSGSLVENTTVFRNFLDKYITDNDITSIIDFGCGDFITMSMLKTLPSIKYYGIDISKHIINENINKFKHNNINFIHGDYLDILLIKADLIILKDVLQHLSTENIHKILENIKGFKHIIIVNDIKENTDNLDIPDGNYRELDIRQKPFNWNTDNNFVYQTDKETKLVSIYINLGTLVTYSTDNNKAQYKNWIAAANFFGYNHVTLGLGEKWVDWPQRTKSYIQFLKNQPKERIIILVDAYDLYMVRSPTYLYSNYKQHFNGKIVFGAESYCCTGNMNKYPHIRNSVKK